MPRLLRGSFRVAMEARAIDTIMEAFALGVGLVGHPGALD
jgi:hypothetical protein